MSDTDYYRYLRDGIVKGIDYHSLKNAKAGVRYSQRIDEKYTGKWLDEDGKDKFGPNHVYQIQKLVAIYAYPAYLEWVNIEDVEYYE